VARVRWIALILASALCAQQDDKQTKPPDQKTEQKPADGQYQEPAEEDESAKPSHEYTFNPIEAKRCVEVGNEYFKAGKYRSAMMRYREATNWNPAYAEAYLRLGQAAEKKKDIATAKQAYAKYIALSPDAKNADEIKKRLASLKN